MWQTGQGEQPRAMRIGIDIRQTRFKPRGIGRYVASLVNALKRLAPEHEYLELDLAEDLPWRVDRLLWWSQWEVPRRAWRNRVDLLHCNTFDAPLWCYCPSVITVHDLIPLLPIDRPNPYARTPAARLYWTWWSPLTLRLAKHIVTVSEYSKQDIMRLLHIPETRISVVPHGVDARFCPVSDLDRLQALRSRYYLPSRFILFVSATEPRKGVDTLLEAFVQLVRPMPELGLVIAGDSKRASAALLAQATDLGVRERLRLTSYVNDDDLSLLYNAADVLAFPSRYEGFGLPVLEAMACGTPVVCSNATSLPEVAGHAALLVPPNDPEALAAALKQVLTDETLYQALREKGLKRAAQFSWEETARKTLAVYEKVAQGACTKNL